jgi:hypothetical protein
MVDLPDAVFHLDGDRAVPTGLARGPWSPHAMHGGAPAALLARAVERHDPGPANFVTRLTIELLRPVPLAPLDVHVRTIRPGRKVQWLEASLTSTPGEGGDGGGTELVRATALRLRADPALELRAPEPSPPDFPGPAGSRPLVLDPSESGWGDRPEIGFGLAFEMREAAGSVSRVGPASVWFRLTAAVVAGETPSPLQRVAAAADFGNGLSALFADGRHTFINADLTISLWRLPEGEWVGIDSLSYAAPEGIGVAESAVVDERGRLGRALQSLLVDRV